MNKCKRFLALLLVLCMTLSVVPFSAFAADGSDETTDGESQNATVETVAEETTDDETTGETTEETTVEGTTEATTVETSVEEEDEPQEEDISSFLLTAEADAYSLTMGTKPDGDTTTGNPFVKGTGGSNSFRIPAMVTLNDGTIVAAADARWNTTYDGGGLDTIVSYSTDNGANWNYTFANFLGDNGNEYNGSGSTAFIDPALATDGKTVYMLCDLYPYGVALNGSGNTAPSTAVGFNSDGKLLLSGDDHNSYNYYLNGNTIYSTNGTAVEGLTVDAYFNVTGTYNGTTYNTNLFFSDSPFKVVRTGYLYLTKSTDGGKTWSAPTLIPNVKTSSEQVCLVGPGRGLVTDNKIIFPVYSYYNGDQQMGFIYSSDGGATWNRSANFTGDSWSSESAVVELDNDTLRFFYRNGNSKLYYADYTWGTGWGSAVNTGIATNSNTQISAISLQNTVGGKQVILVSCPTGSNNAGSADSSASARLNGRIQIGLVDSENYTMTWNTPVDVTTNNSQFMYSCLTALTDAEGNETGKVAILYENQQSAWGTGDNCYYTMAFATYDLNDNVTFDEVADENIYVDDADNGTGISINFGVTEVAADKVTIEAANPEVLSGKTYVAYDITVTDFSGSAKVTIPLNGAFADDAMLYAVYINDNGEIAEDIQGARDTAADTFTFTATHFSTYAVVADESSDTPEYENTQDITLTVGEVLPVTDNTGNYESSYTGKGLNTSIATVNVSGTDGVDSTTNEWQLVTNGVSGINTTDKYLIVSANSGSAYALTSSGGTTPVTISDGVISTESVSTDSNAVFTFTGSGNSWAINGTTGYLYPTATWSWFSWSYSLYTGNTTSQVTISGTSGVTISRSVTSGWNSTISYLTLGSTAGASSSSDTVYLFKLVQEAIQTDPVTTITFTGISAGKTSVVVGKTLYNITVNRKTENVNVIVGGTATYTDPSNKATVADRTVVSATLSDGTLAIAGLKGGTTTVSTDTTVYYVTVKEIPPIVDMESTPFTSGTGNALGSKVTKLTTSVEKSYDLNLSVSGSNITWSSADESIATVDQNGTITGKAAGETTVTCTVDGVSYTIPVAVLYNETYLADNKYTYTCDLYITEVTSTTVKYSINLDTALLDAQEGEAIYLGFDYPFCIDFFGMQDSGYALSYMAATGSKDQYYPLYKVDDVTTLDAYKSGAMHWQAVEMTDGANRVQTLLRSVIDAGFNGATGFTRTQNNGNLTSKLSFRSEKLPTVEKEVAGVLGTSGLTSDYREYTEGMTAVEGETVFFKITVTKYASQDQIDYSDAVLTDNLSGAMFYKSTGSNGKPVTSGNTKDITSSITDSGLDAGTYTYYVLYTIQDSDLDTTIRNTVDFSYKYSSAYSSGTFGGKATADAKITATSFVAKDIVVDFGLPVTVHYAPWGTSSTVLESEGMAAYGNVAVTGDHVNGWDVTYTPKEILRGVDTVTLYGTNNAEYTFKVYPATTVYYEEGFTTYSGNWEDTGSKGSVTQEAQVAGSSKDEYGYDAAYANGIGASNGTQATSRTVGDTCNFTFTGTGFEVYANCDTDTGYLSSVVIQDETGATVKAFLVNTVAKNGLTGAASGQDTALYGMSVISYQNLQHGTYKVTITHIQNTDPIHIDGFRIYGTLAMDNAVYVSDLEDNPTFIELRDQVLASMNAKATNSAQYADQIAKNTLSQVYATAGTLNGVVITEKPGTYTDDNLTDLLDNGPKNEIFLRPGQSLTFTITTKREVQIGLKAPHAATTYTIKDGETSVKSDTISSSTDMFYKIVSKAGSEASHSITIYNSGSEILSVTKLKVCDDPNASLSSLTEEALIPAMLSHGYEKKPEGTYPVEPTDPVEPVNPTDPVEPTEPEQPEVVCKDATLTVSLVDYTGKQITSVDLTANGVEGETKAFTAGEVLAAAKANVPNGYVLVDESKVTGAEVAYGQSGKVTVQIGKTATLKVIYVNLRGKNVGTATFTKVQTSGSSLQISASDIRDNAPAGRRAVWLTNVRVPYGSEMTIVVPTF